MMFQQGTLVLAAAAPVSAMFGNLLPTANQDASSNLFKFEIDGGNVRVGGKTFLASELDATTRAGTSFKFPAQKENTEQRYTSSVNGKEHSYSELDKVRRAGKPFNFTKNTDNNIMKTETILKKDAGFSMPSMPEFNFLATANCAPATTPDPKYISGTTGQAYPCRQLDGVSRAGLPFRFPKN